MDRRRIWAIVAATTLTLCAAALVIGANFGLFALTNHPPPVGDLSPIASHQPTAPAAGVTAPTASTPTTSSPVVDDRGGDDHSGPGRSGHDDDPDHDHDDD